ncbi:MAG: 2-hydroxymuconic semialdehyde dehydrogenase [Chloracidobacterium sp.]|uniref:2-hydroxymuconic semialdehyde dehydrogenase n=1 Tax=Chloracidobacterium validum TaxID=2821543 RepID=A0ABX8B878_9BACT|nr:2-hydroxymuconic semialdehyde dehydrogenase [Chloracidobacterium validum]QUW02899.1 2-hydroxymuconic semialdehyde dehydrogenase [Chloracidobacterium validum]
MLIQRKLFIAGRFQNASNRATFPAYNPATGEVNAAVALATPDDCDAAVAAAKAAWRGWNKLPVAERAQRLRQVADGIEARFDDFLAAEVADTGKPYGLARALDIPRAAANFRIFADLAIGLGTECFETVTDDGAGALNYGLRRPLGVVGVICPWNLPLLLLTWKVAPALVMGNAVVVKPSEETPSTATLLGEVMTDAGILPGVYNVVHGFGPNSTGEWLVAHPDVTAITFTGETRTGQSIMRTAAARTKRLSFELGGKNAAIVFADADFDRAVSGVARSSFLNGGQVCLCSERVYVERPIFERFVTALADEARQWRPGPPEDETTRLGPLISAAHREKVLGYYAAARAAGAEVHAGGGCPALAAPYDQGYFVEPTVWTGLPEQSPCLVEEIFGPVCHVTPFDDEEEVLALANAGDYGLCAAVWTRDGARAHRLAHALEVGVVWINSWFVRDLRTPFGGMKLSGIGREGGRHSLDFYAEIKNVCVKL